MTRIRGFEVVTDSHREHPGAEIQLPRRADAGSAGYDFVTPTDILLLPGGKVTVWTDVKAYMQEAEFLPIYVRSSLGIKCSVALANDVAIIDQSYYSNNKNDGNIGICLVNMGDDLQLFKAGERIAQGIFTPYLVADADNPILDERTGGFGSSGK